MWFVAADAQVGLVKAAGTAMNAANPAVRVSLNALGKRWDTWCLLRSGFTRRPDGEEQLSPPAGIDDEYLESEPSHEILGSAHERTSCVPLGFPAARGYPLLPGSWPQN